MTGKAGIILQARLASARLPLKAVAPIGDRPLIAHCLTRLMAERSAQVILATTDRPEDDALAQLAAAHGAGVFRGHPTDVLARYVAAAEAFGLTWVVRATGDNPAVDPGGPARVLARLRAGADYVNEERLPYGASVEGVTRAALERAAAECRTPEAREHVTIGIRTNPGRFRLASIAAPAPLRRPDLRFTVDTRADLLYMREVFRLTGESGPCLSRLIAAADRIPRAEAA